MSDLNTVNLTNIILIESIFNRAWFIDYENEKFENKVDIDVDHGVSNNLLNVIVNVKFRGSIDDDVQISSDIKMVGIFEFEKIDETKVASFAKINGAAIIYPFIREHLTSLSIKAGLSPILLSPVNFVNMSK